MIYASVFIFLISFLCLLIFGIIGIVKLLIKKESKPAFKKALISLAISVISFILVGILPNEQTSTQIAENDISVSMKDIVEKNVQVEESDTNESSSTPATDYTSAIESSIAQPSDVSITTDISTPETSAMPSLEIERTISDAESVQVEESVSETPLSEAPIVIVEEPTATTPEVQENLPSVEVESASSVEEHAENGSNFNKYNNPEQQNTEELVLNTKTKKIHHSYCSSVAKIKPENYATTTLSVAELEAQGYEKCKQKGDW